MTLDPYFYRCPPELGFNLNGPGMIFKITAYSQYDDYTLVTWRFGTKENYFVGEALYLEKKLLEAGGGQVSLVEASDFNTEKDALARLTDKSPWDRIDSRLGANGVSSSIAHILRDPSRMRILPAWFGDDDRGDNRAETSENVLP